MSSFSEQNKLSEDDLIINQLLEEDILNEQNEQNQFDQSSTLPDQLNIISQLMDLVKDNIESNSGTNTNQSFSEINQSVGEINQSVAETHAENKQNELHLASYEMALHTIPEMLVPTNMIILNGELNDLPVKILLDTGASTSVIFNHAVDRLLLNDLIDTEQSAELRGIGTERSLGQIWYIELKLNGNIYPISLIASTNKITEFDMILGINFLQSYGAVLNFKDRTLTLNDKYEIKFNL